MQQDESSGSVVGEKVQQATDAISTQTGHAVEQGRGVVRDQVGQRSAQLADQVDSASETLRRVAEQSRLGGNAQHARLADQAAQRGERLSSYLQDVEPERLISDAEDFARRQPWLVAGAGLMVGFVLARSLKASSGQRWQAQYGSSRASNGEHRPSPAYPDPVGDVGAGVR
jgi:hypothetical protein